MLAFEDLDYKLDSVDAFVHCLPLDVYAIWLNSSSVKLHLTIPGSLCTGYQLTMLTSSWEVFLPLVPIQRLRPLMKLGCEPCNSSCTRKLVQLCLHH